MHQFQCMMEYNERQREAQYRKREEDLIAHVARMMNIQTQDRPKQQARPKQDLPHSRHSSRENSPHSERSCNSDLRQ